MKLNLQAFVQRAGRLPTLPVVYYELVKVVDRPNSHIDDISAVIRRDPGLVSRILRIANSSFYGFASEIDTLEEAVQLIGLREIQDLVLVTSVIRAFDGVPPRLVDVNWFWRHSVACAIASALLAEERRLPEPDRFFVGGLLHDVGHMVMFLNAPEESRQILDRCVEACQLSSRVEMDVLGFDHALLAGELISLWKLPTFLVEVVRCHHNPAATSLSWQDAFVVHYADFITHGLEYGNSGEVFVAPLLVPAGCEKLLLSGDQMQHFVRELDEKCEQIFSFFVQSSGA
jgi:HD-like signal output (HDOD) protein